MVLEADDDGVVVLRRATLGEHSRFVSLIHAGMGQSEKPLRTTTFDVPFYDVTYEQSDGWLFGISFDGRVSVLDGDGESPLLDGSELHCKELDVSGERVVLLDASSGELLLLDGIEGEPGVEALKPGVRARSARLTSNDLCAALDDESVLVENLNTGDSYQASEFTLARHLSLSFAKYYVSLAFLIVMLVVWFVRKMRNLLRSDEVSKFWRIVISIVVTVVCAVLMGLLSYSSYLDKREAREGQLMQMGSCLGYFSTEAMSVSITHET